MGQVNWIQSAKGQFQFWSEKICPRLAEPEIERHFVHSNHVVALGHDAPQQSLQVEYYNGNLYRIDDVPNSVYRALRDADNFDDVYQTEIVARRPMTRIGSIGPVYR